MYTPRFFASEFWACFRVLGLFRTFHAHTTMLNAHSTIFFRLLGLFASFGFVLNIPRTHLDAQRPPDDFLFPSFGFVSNIPRTHHDAQRLPHDFCYRVLSLLSSFSFVWIDLTRCTKKKLDFSIPILISDFLRQMRYRWNRRHSYITNIVFLNNLVEK